MRRAGAATSAALLLLTLAAPMGAQPDSPRVSQHVFLAAGLANNARLDAAVSPLAFDGHGANYAIAYARARGRYEFSASFDGTSQTLAPSKSLSGAAERILRGDLDLTLIRSIGRRSTISKGFGAGIDVRGVASLTDHSYADPFGSSGVFLFNAGIVGPAVALNWPLGSAAARIELATPALGVVAHSYSNVKAEQSTAPARFASPSNLRGAMGVISIETAQHRRVGLACRYAFSALRYDELQPIRLVAQSASIGIVTRFGAR